MTSSEYFIFYIMALLILALGLIGNLTALGVLHKGKFTKIGPLLIYKLLFISDTLYIIQILQPYFQYAFNLNLQTLSRLACKIFNYLNYQGDALSPFMLIYISLEKYISIAYPAKRRVLTKIRNQIIYVLSILIYCSAYNILMPFCVDLFETDLNETNTTSYASCDFISYEQQLVSTYVDIANRELIPCILMITFSSMLIAAIFKSRLRVANSITDQQRLKRDVRLAVNSFFMNFLFILLNSPLSFVLFYPNVFLVISYLVALYVFYSSYGINFYLIFLFNSLFRKQFYNIFKIRVEWIINKIRT